MFLVDVKVKASKIQGKGTFAVKSIQKGESVFKIDNLEKVFIKDIKTWTEKKRSKFLQYAHQAGKTYYLNCEGDQASWLNHSCDPNCWFEGDRTIVARRSIAPGEELTIDYASIMSPFGLEDNFNCNCKFNNCRRTITKADCLIPSLKKRYAQHFLTFIKKIVAKKA